MAASLPTQIVLGRPGGGGTMYLEYVLETGRNHRRMQLSSKMVSSERNFTRVNVVRAPASVGQDMVHIRSSYNNKFLVLESEGSNFFVAGADEYEEDPSKWSCTLFKATFNSNGLTLLHQSSNRQHSVQISSSCLCIVRNSTQSYWYEVTDMTSLAILPKYVAFKGNNNLYMSSTYRRLRNRLHFASSDLQDPSVHHETIMLNNGNIRLKSSYFGKLWRKSNPEWIWCDTNDTNAYDLDTTYRPVRLNSTGSTIALQNMGNKKYCMRWVRGGQPKLIDTLTASASGVEPLARLDVEEAIRERVISNIRYKLEDARIYNTVLFDDSSLVQDVDNFGQGTAFQRVGFTYSYSTQQTFDASHSWKLSYSTQLKVTLIPALVEGNIQLDATYEGSVKWSETKETSTTQKSDIFVPVPPMSRVRVTMLIGQGYIDVPFSYTQQDILPDGKSNTTHLDDGFFTGRNTEIRYKIDEAISLSDLSKSEFEEARRDALGLDQPEEEHPPSTLE